MYTYKTFVLFTLLYAFPVSNVWWLVGLKYPLSFKKRVG